MTEETEYRNTERGVYSPEDAAEHPEAWGAREEVVTPTDDAQLASAQDDAERAGTPQGGEGGGHGAVTPEGDVLPDGTPSGA